MMNNREQIEQSVISASAYNGNDTEGLLKEVEDVYKKAQAFDEILRVYLMLCKMHSKKILNLMKQ